MQAVVLFGIPDSRTVAAAAISTRTDLFPSTIRALKKELPELVVMSDMCFCEYTEHGHCGAGESPRASRATEPIFPRGIC